MDCARYGRDRRLGHAASLRQAMVREAAALLLGRGNLLQAFWSERGCGPIAECDLRVARDVGHGLACLARLWRGNRALATAFAPDYRRHDRIFARCGDGHAV